jgi:hypothetical protein
VFWGAMAIAIVGGLNAVVLVAAALTGLARVAV